MRALLITTTLLLVSATAQAQFGIRPLTTELPNELGMGLSYGIKLDKDALFWGFAPDYVRVLGSNWLVNLSFAYDQETAVASGSESVTETWTPAVMIGYQLGPRLAVGAGVGHGVFENSNGAGWQSVNLGEDWSAAAAFAVTLWSKGRHGLSLSVSIEYSISDKQPSVSTDLGYGWGF